MLVRSRFEPATSRTAVRCSTNWANRSTVTSNITYMHEILKGRSPLRCGKHLVWMPHISLLVTALFKFDTEWKNPGLMSCSQKQKNQGSLLTQPTTPQHTISVLFIISSTRFSTILRGRIITYPGSAVLSSATGHATRTPAGPLAPVTINWRLKVLRKIIFYALYWSRFNWKIPIR